MGILRIDAEGSFRHFRQVFKAQDVGHAVAVDNAIKMLTDFKGEAIKQDLKLREDGHAPDDNFAEAVTRGLLDVDESCPCGNGWSGIGSCPDCGREHGRIG